MNTEYFIRATLYGILMLMESEQPPYDFIMNSGATPQKKGLLPSGMSKKQRILIVAGAGLALLMIFGIVFNLLFNRPDPTLGASLKMAQQHTEVLRVADIGVKKARSSTTRNLASTVKLSMQSSEDKIVAIASKGRKIAAAQLNSAKDLKTDEALTTADQNNRFDEAFTETIHTQIRAYLAQLRTVYQASKSKEDKKVLDEVHNQLNKVLPAQPE